MWKSNLVALVALLSILGLILGVAARKNDDGVSRREIRYSPEYKLCLSKEYRKPRNSKSDSEIIRYCQKKAMKKLKAENKRKTKEKRKNDKKKLSGRAYDENDMPKQQKSYEDAGGVADSQAPQAFNKQNLVWDSQRRSSPREQGDNSFPKSNYGANESDRDRNRDNSDSSATLVNDDEEQLIKYSGKGSSPFSRDASKDSFE